MKLTQAHYKIFVQLLSGEMAHYEGTEAQCKAVIAVAKKQFFRYVRSSYERGMQFARYESAKAYLEHVRFCNLSESTKQGKQVYAAQQRIHIKAL